VNIQSSITENFAINYRFSLLQLLEDGSCMSHIKLGLIIIYVLVTVYEQKTSMYQNSLALYKLRLTCITFKHPVRTAQ